MFYKLSFFILLLSNSLFALDTLYTIDNSEVILLNEIYLNNNGENWNRKSGWPISNEELSFEGIDTIMGISFKVISESEIEQKYIRNLKVTGISLVNNNLSGELIKIEFDELINLRLQDNLLEGDIPVINCENLEELNLNMNDFNGLFPQINSNKLITLNLSNNNLEGDIPNLDFPELENLFLNDNNFNGTIGEMSSNKLFIYDISNNKLSSDIPVLPIESLQGLILKNNKLTLENLRLNEFQLLQDIANIDYEPQDTLLKIKRSNDTLFIEDYYLEGNKYYWFKNNVLLKISDDNFIPVKSEGVYFCSITNNKRDRIFDETELYDYVLESIEIFDDHFNLTENKSNWILNLNAINSKGINIEVYDLLGNKCNVEIIKQNDKSYLINKSKLTNKFYLILVELNGKRFSKKVLIK